VLSALSGEKMMRHGIQNIFQKIINKELVSNNWSKLFAFPENRAD
jgi:hypothetical protein